MYKTETLLLAFLFLSLNSFSFASKDTLSCFKNSTYYSQRLKVGTTNYRLIFLDNAFYQFHSDDDECVPYIDKSQEYWLNDQLNQASDDVEIILMHIPFSDLPDMGKNSGGLFPVLAANPSVRLILAGHHHRNSIENITLQGEKASSRLKRAPWYRTLNHDGWSV
jgi:3',5'-cyclic AMP phosphodiesterase CpdA